ncbi:MAG: PSD1 domain-containing protein [Planctomycetales bacterium]|nr:PSD1 domain-containing protein [Planctomycetales bacterium]
MKTIALHSVFFAGFAFIFLPCAFADIDFNREVLPILSDKCFHCHGPDNETLEADLRLDQAEHVFSERDGYRIVLPGNTEESELIRRIRSRDPDERMPPSHSTRQLSPAEIELLTNWVKEGAKWTTHWAFEPPQRTASPTVHDVEWTQTPIDRFILQRLEREGLKPAKPADRETLVRRVTLDLTGLPPTLDEIDTFINDASPNSYERLVDRLLASPRYGEHMARPWLDAARYADTDGYQNDRTRYMWPWRDWVIMALNEGMPFDQFTIEQLAGDMLPNATLYQQIATGFGRNHRINSEGGSIPAEWAVEYVVDRVDTLGTVWLGLTIGCARCHDHKYDPMTQRDYYKLFAFFNNVPEWGLGPNNGNSPPFIPLPKSWPHLSTDENCLIAPAPYELVTTQTSVVRPKPGGPETVMVMHELSEPRETYLLRRGQYNQPDRSEVLSPGVPSRLQTRAPDSLTNRLDLAKWLVEPSNPLTARVIVNRYWQEFFGTGIVATSENFGVQGEPPSHPELLDWLATEFMHRDWDVKAMHRLIVTSATYRQSSATSNKLQVRDPDNRLLARGPRVRLSAHEIRDCALAVSGLMSNRIGGESVKPYMPADIWSSISNNKYKQDHGESLYRRSLYTYWRRTIPPPTMMTFNAAEREVCLVRKGHTNSPLQALTLMNNVAFVEASRLMAERILREGGKSLETQISYGVRVCISRHPRLKELNVLRDVYGDFLAEFNANEAAAEKLLSVGEFPRARDLDSIQLAAMTMVASTIMNLDEAVTKE